VDVRGLAAHVRGLSWPVPRRPIPPEADSVIAAVLAMLPGTRADLPTGSLALVRPNHSFPPHRDGQPPGWVTLVHVPVVTCEGAWHLFEEEGVRVHFECGWAYAFDTRKTHCYGNDGPGDRVHLLFDVVRA
jgi:hypothetical protein